MKRTVQLIGVIVVASVVLAVVASATERHPISFCLNLLGSIWIVLFVALWVGLLAISLTPDQISSIPSERALQQQTLNRTPWFDSGRWWVRDQQGNVWFQDGDGWHPATLSEDGLWYS